MIPSRISYRFQYITMALSALLLLGGCSGLGVATGAGAALGIAAAQEGGLRASARDLAIRAKINDLWFQYDIETFAKLNLTVKQGRVLVTGVVDDPEDRVEAIRRAWQVGGVEQVINEVRVADSEGVPGFVRDAWITTRLRTALTLDKYVQSINYTIDTVSGIVYLMGVAQNQAELNRVIEISRTVPHVRQVISYVKMKDESAVSVSMPPPSPPATPQAPSMPPTSVPDYSTPSPNATATGAPMPVLRETLE